MPFTSDGQPAILLPENHRYTYLAMLAAHNVAHSGIQRTVIQFRQDGWWTVKAAKSIRTRCVRCRYLDTPAMSQTMGQRTMEFNSAPSAWKHVEIDLMGPFVCRGEKNPRVSFKRWGAVIEDVYSGAVHCDVVEDYSAAIVMRMMRKFAALRGWPSVVSSDPVN